MGFRFSQKAAVLTTSIQMAVGTSVRIAVSVLFDQQEAKGQAVLEQFKLPLETEMLVSRKKKGVGQTY